MRLTLAKRLFPSKPLRPRQGEEETGNVAAFVLVGVAEIAFLSELVVREHLYAKQQVQHATTRLIRAPRNTHRALLDASHTVDRASSTIPIWIERVSTTPSTVCHKLTATHPGMHELKHDPSLSLHSRMVANDTSSVGSCLDAAAHARQLGCRVSRLCPQLFHSKAARGISDNNPFEPASYQAKAWSKCSGRAPTTIAGSKRHPLAKSRVPLEALFKFRCGYTQAAYNSRVLERTLGQTGRSPPTRLRHSCMYQGDCCCFTCRFALDFTDAYLIVQSSK